MIMGLNSMLISAKFKMLGKTHDRLLVTPTYDNIPSPPCGGEGKGERCIFKAKTQENPSPLTHLQGEGEWEFLGTHQAS